MQIFLLPCKIFEENIAFPLCIPVRMVLQIRWTCFLSRMLEFFGFFFPYQKLVTCENVAVSLVKMTFLHSLLFQTDSPSKQRKASTSTSETSGEHWALSPRKVRDEGGAEWVFLQMLEEHTLPSSSGITSLGGDMWSSHPWSGQGRHSVLWVGIAHRLGWTWRAFPASVIVGFCDLLMAFN